MARRGTPPCPSTNLRGPRSEDRVWQLAYNEPKALHLIGQVTAIQSILVFGHHHKPHTKTTPNLLLPAAYPLAEHFTNLKSTSTFLHSSNQTIFGSRNFAFIFRENGKGHRSAICARHAVAGVTLAVCVAALLYCSWLHRHTTASVYTMQHYMYIGHHTRSLHNVHVEQKYFHVQYKNICISEHVTFSISLLPASCWLPAYAFAW